MKTPTLCFLVVLVYHMKDRVILIIDSVGEILLNCDYSYDSYQVVYSSGACYSALLKFSKCLQVLQAILMYDMALQLSQ